MAVNRCTAADLQIDEAEVVEIVYRKWFQPLTVEAGVRSAAMGRRLQNCHTDI